MQPVALGKGLIRKQWAALTALLYLYAWLVLDPALQFETTPHFPAFMGGLDWALPELTRPGGPVAYLAAWLAQSYRFAALGALVLTAVVGGACWGAGRLYRALAPAPPGWLALVPGTLLLVILNQFDYHLADLLATALAVLAAAGYAQLAQRRPLPRAAVFLGLTVLVYYLTGGGSLLFVGLAAVVEGRRGAGRLAGLLYLLAGELVPQALGVYALELSADRAFLRNSPLDTQLAAIGQQMLLGLWVWLVVSSLGLARWSAASTPSREGRRRWRPALVTVGLLAPVVLSFRGDHRRLLQMNAANERGQYERTLALARRLVGRPFALPAQHALNYALYKQGALGERMFSYPQYAEGLLLGMQCGPRLPYREVRLRRRWQSVECGRRFLELGLANQAEREAHEALTRRGEQAPTLRLLADINLVKKQPATARRYLYRLLRCPTAAAWARERLAALDRDPDWLGGEELRAARERLLDADVNDSDVELDKQCRALLRRNPTNRMAFEYLLAYHLLNRDLKRFMTELEGLPRVGYSALPRHWQEAAVLAAATGHLTLGLPGYRVDPAVYLDFQRFSALVTPLQQRGALREAERAAARDFGNTYFYYYVFGQSGVGKP